MYESDLHRLGPRLKQSERVFRNVQFGRFQQVKQVSSLPVPNPTSAATKEVAMNREEIGISKSMFGRITEFFIIFLNESSLHGLVHLVATKRSYVEYGVWAVFVLLGLIGAIWLSLNIWNHYDGSPTVISMERDFMAWNTTFPAGTVCSSNKVDGDKLEEFVNRMGAVENKTEVKEFLMKLAYTTYHNFSDLKDIPNNPIKSEDYLKAILEIRFNLSYTAFNNDERTPDPPVRMSITEMGICNTYFTQVATYNDPHYWTQNNWTIVPRTREWIVAHPIDGSRAAQIINMNTELIFFFHSTYDVPDIADKYVVIREKYQTRVDIRAMTTYTTPEAKDFSVKQRKCRYPEENNLKISPVYTLKFCQIECRIRLAYKLCDCIPYFYRRIENYKVCDVKGMNCLGDHAENLITLRKPDTHKREPCNCLPPCNEISYYLDNVYTSPSAYFMGTAMEWGIRDFPRMRLKRDVLFGIADLWVSIGGTGGLFLGCSVLSLIEILYFFTLRFFIYMFRSRAQRR